MGMNDPNPYLPPADLVECLEERSTDELVLLLGLFRATRKGWAEHEAVIEAEIADRCPPGLHESDGATFKVRKGSTSYDWDHDALRRLVVARGRDRRSVDPDTGEVLESEGEAVGRAIFGALGKNPPWTVGGLADLGIEAAEHRVGRNPKRSVEIVALPDQVDSRSYEQMQEDRGRDRDDEEATR